MPEIVTKYKTALNFKGILFAYLFVNFTKGEAMHISNSSYSSFYSNYAKATNQDSKLTQDFRLTNDKFTNTESEKIQISASQTESLQTESLQTAMLR